MGSVSGVVYGDDGAPLGGIITRAYRRDTGDALGACFSSSGSGPAIADDNATFTNEGDSTTGWTAANGTMSVSGSVLRLTKTGGTNASVIRSVTLPGSNLDFLFFGKVKMSNGVLGDCGTFWLQNSGASVVLAFWMNYNSTIGSPQLGTLSIVGYESGSARNAVVATGVNTTTDFIEFCIQYDHKWSTANCFLKQADGTWDLKARVACTFTSYTDIRGITGSAASVGTWMEFDYLMVSRPNIMVIGDSIAEGKSLYSPNRGLALSNYLSCWPRYAVLRPALRNTVVCNKGVGSESSTATLARITDVTGQSPRLVFLHASTNDQVLGVSAATRTSNIQSSINAITAAGASAVLLNAMYGTSANAINPAHKNYMSSWWTTDMPTLTGLAASIDIMEPITASGYMNTALTQGDGIHPTLTGYRLIGQLIEAGVGATRAAGAYSIDCGSFSGEAQVVCLDNAGGTSYNDLILRTTPV